MGCERRSSRMLSTAVEHFDPRRLGVSGGEVPEQILEPVQADSDDSRRIGGAPSHRIEKGVHDSSFILLQA